MINRIFFLTEITVLSDAALPVEEGVYFSIPADPSQNGSLENAYDLLGRREHAGRGSLPPLALALDIRQPLTDEQMRSIASFLFLPSYLRIEDKPVIQLTGASPAPLSLAAAALSGFLSQQGITEPVIHTLTSSDIFRSVEELAACYRDLLKTPASDPRNLFFYAASGELLASARASLQQAELELEQRSPQLFALTHANGQLKKELHRIRRTAAALSAELSHQQQYVEVLRSGHAAKEIQDHYTREYEALPLWYKRFGHVLQVIGGRRTFKSLYRDDAKKYKDQHDQDKN